MNRSRLGRAAVPAGFALLHATAVLLGRASAPEGSPLAVVWPAAGIGFVWLARSWRSPRERWRDAALLLVSGTAAQLLTGKPAGPATLLAATGAVQALAACWVHQRFEPRGFRLRRPRDVWVLTLAAVSGALAGALVGVGAAGPAVGTDRAVEDLLSWTVRHTASTLAVAVLWLWVGDRTRTPVRAEAGRSEVLLVAVATCASLGWLYAQPSSLPLAFLMTPLSVWTGLRLAPLAALGTTVAGDALLVLVWQHGPFATLPEPRAALYSQLLALVLIGVVTPLVLHREERQRLDAELREAYREVQERSARLTASEQRFRLAFDTAPVAMFMVGGGGGRVLEVNATACAFTGRDETALRRLRFADLLHPGDAPAHRAVLEGPPRTGAEHRALLEGRYLHAGGDVRRGLLSAAPVPGRDGAAPYLLCLVEDVTARRAAEAALLHQARHDALTGLPNRVLLGERLRDALAAGPAAVLYCDLDGFKDVNDTAGHAAGDAVLREVAARFAACLREGDTLARSGGDEFAVVRPGTGDPGEVVALGERLVAVLREPVGVAAGGFSVGVSVGVAAAGGAGRPGHRSGPDLEETAERLVAAADAAMYTAKRAGKGRVHVGPGPARRPHRVPPQVPARSAPSPGSSSGGTRQ
ncbi:diguanylate cyclase domain-containing protein [Kineococcus auxinigenes]|uniref:diguanylate cyclase domain-containing protein n=1 Tax=unclassified Kineococcus TaxID=2621656 RepID=UPI003D7CDFC6